MKEFACGVAVPGCSAHFRAETEEELFRHVAAHARDDHDLHEISPELVAAVREHIHVSPAA